MDRATKKDYIDQLDALVEDPAVQRDDEASNETDAFNVLVSLSDDDLALATTSVARALYERRGARPSVLYVIEIGPSVPEAAMVSMTLEDELRDPRVRAKQEADMKSVLRLNKGAESTWPFSLEVGSVATSIVENARSQGARLIMMGLNRHAVVARVLGKDTVREVMALSGVPVLAVRPALYTLPKRVVVAVDFSRASVRAAHLARWLVDEHGTMDLLFVESGVLDGPEESAEGLRMIQSKGVDAAFAQLIAALSPASGVTINSIVRSGSPVEEIVRFCEGVTPNLVAIGSQRHRFLDRLILGSVARSIAVDGRWSVLVTPPEKAARS